MKIKCKNSCWGMDPENGRTMVSFIHGKVYEAENVNGRITVINEQNRNHVIKTKTGLGEFFDRHFELLQGKDKES